MRGGLWWGGALGELVCTARVCDFAPNLTALLASGLVGSLRRGKHGSTAELHRRRVPEYGHWQERRPALASAQVLAGLGSGNQGGSLSRVGHLAWARRPTCSGTDVSGSALLASARGQGTGGRGDPPAVPAFAHRLPGREQSPVAGQAATPPPTPGLAPFVADWLEPEHT